MPCSSEAAQRAIVPHHPSLSRASREYGRSAGAGPGREQPSPPRPGIRNEGLRREEERLSAGTASAPAREDAVLELDDALFLRNSSGGALGRNQGNEGRQKERAAGMELSWPALAFGCISSLALRRQGEALPLSGCWTRRQGGKRTSREHGADRAPLQFR